MVMLHSFASLCPRPDFSVITVNHGIREQAQSDCDFVKSYCDRLNVRCKVVSVNVPQYAKEHKLSEETAARILRYRALDEAECDFVCLAHQVSDNAETVLMHILRGSGARGASGIRRQNGRYLRPILDMTRDEIERYAAEHDVPYVSDATNYDVKYSRNFVRNRVMPLLKTLNPEVEQSLVRFAENVSADSDYLDSLADVSTVEFCETCARVPVALLKQPKPVAFRVVGKVFNALGCYKDIEKKHVNAVLELANGAGGRRICLPFGLAAINDYDCVTITREDVEPPEYFEIPFVIGKTRTPAGLIEVSKDYRANALKFDLSKLPDDAVFRLRREGDVFTKFGGGSKPLKKYLIDKKIPQRHRESLTLVASGKEIFIICGVEISDKIKVDEQSDVYYVSITKRGDYEIQ